MSCNLRPIADHEVQWLTPYQVDDAGRVFGWSGGIYRCINRQSEEFYRVLFSEKGPELIQAGVIPTEITDHSLADYSLVLKHQKVPYVTYCVEWSQSMLRDAALMLCDLGETMWQKDLALTDAHPWNVLFHKGSPKMIDVGAIRAVTGALQWPYAGIREFFWLPLLLMTSGKQRLARAMMLDVRHNWSRGDVFRLVIGRATALSLLAQRGIDGRLLKQCRQPSVEFFRDLRRLIASVPVADGDRTEWSEYSGVGERWQSEQAAGDEAKVASVSSVLSALHPSTVADVGCNKGWFSCLAAKSGADVVAIDVDEPSISQLYKRVRGEALSISPVVMDITRPTPEHGIAGAYPSAEVRFRSDLVLSLATMHHLVLRQGLTFESLGKLFAGYARRWLLLEFIPPEDPHMKNMLRGDTMKYTKENLIRAFSPWFDLEKELPSSPSPRVLLLFGRK